VRLISKDRDGDTLNEHGVVSLPTLSRMPSAMSKTESWNIPKRNRGAEHIPHGVLGSLRDSYIVDMMVYGVPGDFVANNPSRFQITSSDMLKHQFERTMDFFFGLIYALNQYLAECRKVRKSLEQKDRETGPMTVSSPWCKPLIQATRTWRPVAAAETLAPGQTLACECWCTRVPPCR
jgi:hypothetical protein